MEESVSGFKVQGDWEDISEHGERITAALRKVDCSKKAFSEWNEWRPKPDEHINPEMREKTAEQAHTDKGSGEKADQSPSEDLLTAGKKLTDAYEQIETDDADEAKAIDEWHRSVQYVTRAADTAGREIIRPVEDTVYKRAMTKISPFYFDNALVSANLQKTRNGEIEPYVFEIDINDDELKATISEHLDRALHSYEWTERDTNKPMTGVRMNCSSCGHRWMYDGDSEYYAACPNCNRSVRIKR